MKSPGRPRRARLALGLAAAALAACATYSDHTRRAREQLSAGDLAGSLSEFNDMLGVDRAEDVPDEFGSETALALAERAMVLHAMGRYEQSARDLQIADKQLELLDLANDTVGDIGKYLYSDDSTRYKASPTEKLTLNAINMINYLARGDLAGAKVEARRWSVMKKYLDQYFPGSAHGAFGAYLAGFVFEKLGEREEALRYYDRALEAGSLPTLAGPIARLRPQDSYRTRRIEALLAAHPSTPDLPPGTGEVLVIVKTGRVPAREPARMPIGAALGLASNYVSGDTKVLEYGLFKVLTYPELMPARTSFTGASVRVDGEPARAEPLTDLGRDVRAEYEAVKPKLIGAGLTRMITRAVAAEGARALGRKESGLLGFLAAAATEGTLVALDRPDTRSWSTLPGQVSIARAHVPAGKHRIAVRLEGFGTQLVEREVDVPEGGFAVVDVTTLR